MNKFLLLVCLILLVFQTSSAEDYTLPNVQVLPIKDTQNDKQYELYVKLPDGYSKQENQGKSYPVIYFTDAVWHIEILSVATSFLMEEAILVGISWQKDIEAELKKHGEHVSRNRDYTVNKSTNPKIQEKYKLGQASNHLAFIRNDVFKKIESNYRTQADNRSYFGYSLGGLFGAYALLTEPDTFRNYILGSPALDGDMQTLTELADKVTLKHKALNANVYITYGTLENKAGKQIDQLITTLRSKNDKTLLIEARVVEGTHMTAFPLTGVHSMTWLSNLAQEDTLKLSGPYMGQQPPAPGAKAKVFAPGIVSTPAWEVQGVFSPAMDEFYVTVDKGADPKAKDKKFTPTIIGYRMKNNRWNKYLEIPRNGEIAFTPDGNRMYLAEGYRDRIGSGWTERKSLGPMFEQYNEGIMRLTVSAKGTYVFDDYKSNDLLRISKIENGIRQEPQELPKHINTGEWTAHPFIAPDESYLIWDSERPEGFGGPDLYISFKQDNGTWGPAINMGETVNTDRSDSYATVTSDGKYIVFNRHATADDENRNIDIFWADAQIIEELRAKQ